MMIENISISMFKKETTKKLSKNALISSEQSGFDARRHKEITEYKNQIFPNNFIMQQLRNCIFIVHLSGSVNNWHILRTMIME